MTRIYRPLTQHDVPRITRFVLILAQVEDGSSSVAKDKLVRWIYGQDANVRAELNANIHELIKRSGRPIRPIKLSLTQIPGDSPALEDYLINLSPTRRREVRIIIDLVGTTGIDNPEKFLDDHGASHVVRAVIQDLSLPSKTPLTATSVQLRRDHLPWLIQDIALDIAMGRALAGDDGISSRAFNLAKATFLASHGAVPWYLQPGDPPLFVPIAGVCRRKDGSLDVMRYEELWSDFCHEAIHGITGRLDPHTVGPVEDIWRSFRFAGSLPREEIEAAVSRLGPGNYLLMMSHREPSLEKTKGSIIQVMRTGKLVRSRVPMEHRRKRISGQSRTRPWKRGLWRIASWDEYSMLARWYPYIVFFPFYRP